MKVFFFKYRNKNINKNEIKHVYFERFLYIAFICTFITLIAVQVAHFNPVLKSELMLQDDIEGAPLGTEGYLYTEGTIELELPDADSNPLLKVLVNGEEKACFVNKNVVLNVIDGDLVEIDGSDVKTGATVKVSSVSNNISEDYYGKTYNIQGSVQKIIKVNIDLQ